MSNEAAPTQDELPVPKDASAPFSGAVEPGSETRPADFILRSSDGVDFHVRKDMLRATSDFFDNMFSAPSTFADPNELSRDGKPVLSVEESARALYALLSLAYPRQSWGKRPIDPLDIDRIVAVYAAADKYQFSSVQRLMKEMLAQPALLDAHPHRLFAIGELRGLPALSRKAAMHTLTSPVSPAALKFPEMDLLTWSTSHKLYNFHRRCCATVSALVEKTAASSHLPKWQRYNSNQKTRSVFTWWENRHNSKHCEPYANGQDNTGQDLTAPAKWFQNHVAHLASRLRISPSARTVQNLMQNIAPEDREVIDACDNCSQFAQRDLETFGRELTESIESVTIALAEELL
ncbi:hypothetical protein DFH06DRAFT_1478032 [Mycena polygramma]|nr:hypothetical protein DFH06DRAFT_1478032 [Mycena polygramma]